MKTYSKNYFGKGTQVTTNTGFALDIVKITLSVEQIIELAHDYNGKQYITFEVAKMKGLDSYGHTHTVYQSSFADKDEKTGKPVANVTPDPVTNHLRKPTPTEQKKIEAARKKAEKVKARQELSLKDQDIPF
jgi:hypothetical protein